MFEVKLRIFQKGGKLFNDLIPIVNYQSAFSTGTEGSIFGTLSFGTVFGPGRPSFVFIGVTPSTYSVSSKSSDFLPNLISGFSCVPKTLIGIPKIP